MKKITGYIMSLLLLLSCSGCGKEEIIVPNSFPLETSFINETLEKNGIDFAVEDSRDYSTRDDIFNYTYNIERDEYPLRTSFGILQVIWGSERGNYVGITCPTENGNSEGTEKIAKTVCELYGSPDGKAVAKKLVGDMRTGKDLVKIDYGGYEWKYELNGVYYSALFSYKVNYDGSETVSLVSFSANDRQSVEHDEKMRTDPEDTPNKMLRENREKYPLLYTTETIDYPPQPADEDIIALFKGSGLDIVIRTSSVATVNGNYLTQYTLWDTNKEEIGAASVRNYVSGRQIFVSYNLINSDFNLREDAVERAVKMAGILYDDVEDIEGIVSVAEIVIDGYDYKKENSLEVIFEHEGIYGTVNFGFESLEDRNAGNPQFQGVTLYEPGLYSAYVEYGLI